MRWLALVLLVSVAAAGTDDALRDVLADAPVIVRGTALDGAFGVDEVLRGDVAGATVAVRLLDGDEPLARGEPMVLLLDGKTADGAYPLHHPAGRYRVDGDDVIVNASGVDGAALSPKDLRPRAPDERISLARFRQLAGVTPHAPPAPNAPPPAPIARPRSQPPADLPPPGSQHSQLPWFAGALVVLVVILVGIRRAH